MNFNIKTWEMGNQCHNENGTCCMKCIYVSDGETWKACTDSCLLNIEVAKNSCERCLHSTYRKQ